jgi:hypothetical protein
MDHGIGAAVEAIRVTAFQSNTTPDGEEFWTSPDTASGEV